MNYGAVNELLTSAGLFDPEEYGVSVAVTFGYRAREIAPKSRRSIEDPGHPGPNVFAGLSARFSCRIFRLGLLSLGFRVGRLS